MEHGRAVRTSLSTLVISTDDTFLDTFALFELNVDSMVGKDYKTKYAAMTVALIALRDGNRFRHALSAVFKDAGRVYLMCEKQDASFVQPSLKGTKVAGRRLKSVKAIDTEILCDLALKYEVLKTMPSTCVLQRARGVNHKYSETMMISTYFKAKEDASDQVILCSSGQNIRKTNKKTGTPYPFIFTSSGILIYPGEGFDDAQRYIPMSQDDGKLKKTKAITFSGKEDEASQSKLLHMSNALRLLNNTCGLTASPVVWEGIQYAKRIGAPKEDYALMEKKALDAVMDRGITIRAGKGIALQSVKTLETYFNVLFSHCNKNTGIVKVSGTKISRIFVKGEDIVAVKAAKKMFFPINHENGWTEFYCNGTKVSSVTTFSLSVHMNGIKAVLYDTAGALAGEGMLAPYDKENVWYAGRSAVRDDGDFIIEVIPSKAPEVAYEKSFDTQHITEDVLTSTTNTAIIALCKNLIFQLIIKDDIKSGKFTFLPIPEFAGYEFLYASKGRFASMKIIDGISFTLGKMSLKDEIRFRNMQEIKNSGEYYAIKSPVGNMTVIEDSGISLMADPSFTVDNAKSRSRIKENDLLAPFMDYIYYEFDGEQYYTAGWNLADTNNKSYVYIPRIRHLKTDNGDKWDMSLLFDLMNVPFVRMSQANTVVPFPFKYLREYAFTVLEEEKADSD